MTLDSARARQGDREEEPIGGSCVHAQDHPIPNDPAFALDPPDDQQDTTLS